VLSGEKGFFTEARRVNCISCVFTVNIEDPTGISAHKRPRKEKEPEKPKKVVVVGSEPEDIGNEEGPSGTGKGKEKGDKATDDFHFEKFKKQFRRY